MTQSNRFTQQDQNAWQSQYNAANQKYQTGERTQAQQFSAGENQKNRDFNQSERTSSQNFAASESQKNRDFNTSERTKSQDFAESQRVAAEAFQSKENAKSRAQNFLAQQVMNAGNKFSAGQDYTGGATSSFGGSFSPNGRSRKKIDYSFKR